MEIIQVPVDQLKPDPNQPRKQFDPIHVRELSQAIVTEGVINPIEIDKNNMIVTGELRWRASKQAGLKTVPCKIIEITEDDRFERQVIENWHHNTMSAPDTATALGKMLGLRGHHEVSQGIDSGISKLAERIGTSEGSIREYLKLLKEDVKIMDWLQSGGKKSLIFEANKHQLPEETRNKLKNKIINNEITHARTVRELGRAIETQPDKEEYLLGQNYITGSEEANLNKIAKVVPKEKDLPVEMVKGSELWSKFYAVMRLLETLNPNDILSEDRERIIHHKDRMIKAISRFENLQAEEAELVVEEVRQLN